MARVIPLAYKHEQATASSQWNITHNLSGTGNQLPIVDVFTTVDNIVQKIIPNQIEIIDSNTVRITFSVARSGFAIVLV